MAQKAKKKSKLRHAEYYDMQKTFDSLYADSKSGEVFGNLMDIISAPSNIKLAFRNIKGNDGSHTAGTDGRTKDHERSEYSWEHTALHPTILPAEPLPELNRRA